MPSNSSCYYTPKDPGTNHSQKYYLDAVDCAAWHDLCTQLGASKGWSGWEDQFFDKPCDWDGKVACELVPGEEDDNTAIHDGPHITRLYMQGVGFKGSLPDSLSTLSHMRNLDFSNNLYLTGPMPDLTTMSGLRGVSLGGCALTGSLPDFHTATELDDLWLNSNQFEGTVPDWLSQMTQLSILNIGGNKLDGELPDLSRLSALTSFHVENNKFHGKAPAVNYSAIEAAGELACGIGGPLNQWSCPLPVGADKCSNNGEFPVVCVNPSTTAASTTAALAMGVIWGTASFFALCKYIYGQCVARRERPLGEKPRPLMDDDYGADRRMRIYRLLQKEMEATRPSRVRLVLQGLVVTFQLASFAWVVYHVSADFSAPSDHAVCGDSNELCVLHVVVLACVVLTSCASVAYGYRQCHNARKRMECLQQGTVSDAPLGDFGAFLLQGEFTRRAQSGTGITDIERVLHTIIYDEDEDCGTTFVGEEFDDSSKAFTSTELRQATNGFHQRNKLDEGAFGAVYRGSIEGGTDVAIKILKLERQVKDQSSGHSNTKYSGTQSFVREAKLLATYCHPNLVRLLGHYKGDDTMPQPALLFEFMTGGSLEDRVVRLLPGQTALSPTERFAAASDTARGLAFLHGAGSNRPPLIHQDIKPANILLCTRANASTSEPTLVAKLADFGLARIAPDLARDSVSHVSTQTVAGTLPYMPPEFVMSHRVSTKTDAFAFGVVLMQLLTARPPVHPVTRELLVDELDPVTDDPEGKLPAELDNRAGAWQESDAVSLVRIATRCLEARPQRRSSVIELVPDLDRLAGRDALVLAPPPVKADRPPVGTHTDSSVSSITNAIV